jgi:CheY-like chemotaxis protein
VKILLVEDDSDCAASTAMLLALWGHEVQAVRYGPAAVRAARDHRPDIVLLDIGLPGGMDGGAVAERINGEANGRKPLIVTLTGYGTECDRRRSEESGISIHLLKPLEPEWLEQLLDDWQGVLDRQQP